MNPKVSKEKRKEEKNLRNTYIPPGTTLVGFGTAVELNWANPNPNIGEVNNPFCHNPWMNGVELDAANYER